MNKKEKENLKNLSQCFNGNYIVTICKDLCGLQEISRRRRKGYYLLRDEICAYTESMSREP